MSQYFNLARVHRVMDCDVAVGPWINFPGIAYGMAYYVLEECRGSRTDRLSLLEGADRWLEMV